MIVIVLVIDLSFPISPDSTLGTTPNADASTSTIKITSTTDQ